MSEPIRYFQDRIGNPCVTKESIAIEAISAEIGDGDCMDGYIVCPVCKRGTLGYSVSERGRLAAYCDTPNCVSIIDW